jgi:hypothetical protein
MTHNPHKLRNYALLFGLGVWSIHAYVQTVSCSAYRDWTAQMGRLRHGEGVARV